MEGRAKDRTLEVPVAASGTCKPSGQGDGRNEISQEEPTLPCAAGNGADRSPLPLDGRLLGRPFASMERLENMTRRQCLLANDLLRLFF